MPFKSSGVATGAALLAAVACALVAQRYSRRPTQSVANILSVDVAGAALGKRRGTRRPSGLLVKARLYNGRSWPLHAAVAASRRLASWVDAVTKTDRDETPEHQITVVVHGADPTFCDTATYAAKRAIKGKAQARVQFVVRPPEAGAVADVVAEVTLAPTTGWKWPVAGPPMRLDAPEMVQHWRAAQPLSLYVTEPRFAFVLQRRRDGVLAPPYTQGKADQFLAASC